MEKFSIEALFVIGICSTDILSKTILEALFCVGKSKSTINKIEKTYSFLQRYWSKHVVLPLEYNNRTARFFKRLRIANLIVGLPMLIVFFIGLEGDVNIWITAIMFVKVFCLDVPVIIYSWWHSGRKFFRADMTSYDFGKKK